MNRNAALALLLLAGLCRPLAMNAQEFRAHWLSFPARNAAGWPAGWSGGPQPTIRVDSTLFRSAPYAARLQRGATDGAGFSTLTLAFPLTFQGDSLELRGWLRTRDVQGWAGLWLREDGPAGSVQFNNMADRQLRGTTEWTQYRIRLPLDTRARTLYLGALVAGAGTVWVDDLELLVDGRPAAEAPRRTAAASAVEADHEFDAGSRIAPRPLTPAGVDNLVLLGRVWGFVKYHHPRVTGGQVNWDYELFRVMPAVLNARDRAAALPALNGWLERLGEPAPCNPCAQLPAGAHLLPDTSWIADRALLGDTLSAWLQRIHRNRHAAGPQYYVTQAPGVRNPDFSNEATYPQAPLPDAGYRLLALFRFWNIIEYWFPYRDVIGEDWKGVLAEFVPRLLHADDARTYRLQLMQLTARIHDTHANLWGELSLRPPVGEALVPVTVRFVEGKAVVTGYTHSELGPASGLRPGDVIDRIDGARIDSLVAAWEPYYAGSNETSRLRDMAGALTRGDTGAVRLGIVRGGRPHELLVRRVPLKDIDLSRARVHDLPGATFQRLTDDVAYLKLSSIEAPKTAEYIRSAAGAKVLVIDIRNYPSQFVVFALGQHLAPQATTFARFTTGDLTNPGLFRWTDPLPLVPSEPHFDGRVVVLVDEVSLSQAEYTAMAFRAAGATVVGSTTAGADGNVSAIPLPGGTAGMISGIGVFYPDRRPTQRVGIIPDLEVRPTIAGIVAGRDEVLEAAVTHALGREFRLPGRQ